MDDDQQLLTVEQWNEYWKKDYERSKGTTEEGKPHEHEHRHDEDDPFNQKSPMLTKHIRLLIPDHTRQRIFLPLCGKSLDMLWLIEEGYEVVGLECSEHAVLEFFEQHSIEFETTTCPGDHDFRVYKGKKSNITIFQGDYFKFTKEIAGGAFDAIWDAGSLNTIDLSLRKPYVKVMTSLLAKHSKYMLDAMYFGEKKTWKHNPYDISDQDMTDLFTADYTWTKVDEDDSEWGLERVFLLSFK